jgi:biotin/methionine sulfoxide reductase
VTKITQTASHWGVYSVETTEHGAIGRVLPFAQDRSPPSLIHGLPEIVRSPLRIDQPYVRRGYLERSSSAPHNRGGEPFVPVHWDTALDLVEAELRRVKDEFGNEAIYGGSYGWASAGRLHHSPSVLKRFLGLFGGYVDKLGNHSFGAALGIMPYVLGRPDVPALVAPWSEIVANTKLFVMFGGAHSKNSKIDSGGATTHDTPDWVHSARQAGVRFVTIGPSRGDAIEGAESRWIPLRPNTDLALMIGIAHSLASQGLHDRQFLEKYCEGYPIFERYLLGVADGQPKTAEWAEHITGVPAQVILELATAMAATRTLVTTSWSVQRADHGELPVWMTVVLASMLGQIGLPGGGFSLGFGATSNISSPKALWAAKPTLPLGPNPVKVHIPVGRVADMLLNPGSELEYNGTTIRLPEIKLIYSVGGNPFHHNGNLNRFLKAWQRPDTIIVHEPWWNPAAKHADIVLPATTTMERNDILATEGQRYFIAMKQVIAPVHGARNDFDVFAELADRLGFGAAYTEGRDEMGWLRHMYETARAETAKRGIVQPDFETFWQSGCWELPMLEEQAVLLGAFRKDQIANPLRTPSGRIEIFSEQIQRFSYSDCPPHPMWLEPSEWLGSKKIDRFPLHLLSNQPATRLHSQLDPSTASCASKLHEREPIELNVGDAKARGINLGDIVRVFNERGEFLAAAVPVDHLIPGVAQVATGAWYDPEIPGLPGSLEKHGNPNVVTSDTGTSRLSQSPVAQTVLIEIEKYNAQPPRISAFDVPKIVIFAQNVKR